MYGLSLGIQNIGQSLPLPVYALLSGLNASIVGIVALAAVQLSDKAIRDKLTRIEVLFGACAGVCYNSLWYFPILMLASGLASVIWDGWMARQVRRLAVVWQSRHSRLPGPEEAAIPAGVHREIQSPPTALQELGRNGEALNTEDSPRQATSVRSRKAATADGAIARQTPRAVAEPPRIGGEGHPEAHSKQIWIGILLLVVFFGRIFIPRQGLYAKGCDSFLYHSACCPRGPTPATARPRSLR